MNSSIVPVLSTVAPWIAPPLLGAIIGYLTNSLAIRMLFRPLRRVEVFGIALPLTPGVIPKQRKELAESIGRMVSQELLTPGVFQCRFQDPAFRYVLRRGIGRSFDRIITTPIGVLSRRVPLQRLIPVLRVNFKRAIALPAVKERVVSTITALAHGNRDLITRALRRYVDSVRPLATLDDRGVKTAVGALWPRVVSAAEHMIRAPGIQRKLDAIVRRVLAHTLDQLNGLQRLVVTAGQYDRALFGRVPSIVSRTTTEIIAFLRSDDARHAVVDRLSAWVASPEASRFIVELIGDQLDDPERVSAAIRPIIMGEWTDEIADRLLERGSEALASFLQENGDQTTARLFPAVARTRGYVARRGAGWSAALLQRVAPGVVASLNIHDIVVDRINDLDIETVEELLLGIIRRQLRWINAFGALLGAMIGGVQLVLRVVGW